VNDDDDTIKDYDSILISDTPGDDTEVFSMSSGVKENTECKTGKLMTWAGSSARKKTL
jgi:hypothetical protein